MGKLHTLRRAILREPETWYETWYGYQAPGRHPVHVHGAWCWRGQWLPGRWASEKPYRAFVAHVLKTEVGIADIELG